ncbi:type II toxin-antitoxin system RelB/DinJ family antitoxin [uncultured Selenomonas sp.]|uniref:type II toxin-antitoxin system RelB/DinJ family antitoxin n=1 Tax=uncultured Selenomonas sp. TaxID=159275 RepID=UPI0025D2A04C|nr:type II toxin-antitoxin system RelB/DinJ family antitoxin [uncultured Selenomonas sp.]
MATANVQVRMDADLKRSTEDTLKSMGLTMSAAITMFCKQVVNQGKIPFEIIAGNTPNEETRKAMQDTLAGKNLSRTFDTVDEMWEDLNA